MEFVGNRIFWIMLLLIGVVYFVGVYTDTAAFSSAFVQVGNMLTGRNSSGSFQNYPSNASGPALGTASFSGQ